MKFGAYLREQTRAGWDMLDYELLKSMLVCVKEVTAEGEGHGDLATEKPTTRCPGPGTE